MVMARAPESAYSYRDWLVHAGFEAVEGVSLTERLKKSSYVTGEW
jgi:hypothetical protein